MTRRLPSQPPVLPGFMHLHVLGSGGFADVFLYEQNMPRRQVAVKVMLSDAVNDNGRQMFQAEANLMAQLSSHPSILTVYQASVSSDGRPYLVMELCSSMLSDRYRREPIPVPDVLRIAVKIGSALETAHRAGVLHRDVKPSNILTTAYGHPVLSDFGIAATLSQSHGEGAIGLSIPWSAPEVLLDESAGSVESEVFSLAATVYSLLAGRSPFEVPGGSNTSADLINRITRGKPQPIGRADVPGSLEQALLRGMSRKPENRPSSVLELVREFQAVESELGVPQTAIEVAMDDWALATVADLEDRTRIRGVTGAVTSAKRRRRRAAVDQGYQAVGTMVRDSRGQRSTGTASAGQSRGMKVFSWMLVGSAVLVIALGATATMMLIRANSSDIPVVANIAGEESGGVVRFSWADPGLAATDSYDVRVGNEVSASQQSTSFTVDAQPGENVCITVTVNREGKTGPSSAQKCVEAAE
ncbi:MAG: serine/threonine-protein kinase [Microbacteriaceae bacterium]